MFSSQARFCFLVMFGTSFEIEIVNGFRNKILVPLLCGSKSGRGWPRGIAWHGCEALCPQRYSPGSHWPWNSYLADSAFWVRIPPSSPTPWVRPSLAQPPAVLFEYPWEIPFSPWHWLYQGREVFGLFVPSCIPKPSLVAGMWLAFDHCCANVRMKGAS